MPTILSIDTETCLGQLRVIGCSDGSFMRFSQGEYHSPQMISVIDWMYGKSLSSDYVVFWNINFDYSIILKPFLIENEQRLHDDRLAESSAKQSKAETDAPVSSESPEDTYMKFSIGKYKVRLLNHKAFTICHNRKTVYFFDAANYYITQDDAHMSLSGAGYKYLGTGKDEWGSENRKRMGSDPRFFDDNEQKIISYCISDCSLTARLFDLTIKSYSNIGLNFPEKPFSKASIFKQYLRDTGALEASQEHYSAIASLPIFPIIKKSYRGAVNQIYAVGKFDNVTDVDINSAYPFAMLNLKSPGLCSKSHRLISI